MLVLKLLLYPFIIIYGGLAIFAYRTARKTFFKYRKIPDIEHDPQWQGFIRKDFNQWDEKQILIGSLIRFPLKLLILLFLVLITMASIRMRRLGSNLMLRVSRFLFSLVMTIEDQGSEQRAKTPIVISNHVSWLDIIYLWVRLQPISYVTKEEVSGYPLFGEAAKIMQCLLVKRQSKEARNEILIQIRKRIQQYTEGQSVHPLLIFPQGTTSNGHSILRFKNGAFTSLPPITIFALIYECEGFGMGMEEITPVEHMIITLCLSPRLKVKSTVMHADIEESEQSYKQRCQKKLSQLTGFKIYQAGYTEKCIFGAKRREIKHD